MARKITSVEDTLTERQATHGNFEQYSSVVRELKDIIALAKNLHVVQQEALDQIMGKIARIIVGNPDEPDHWHDIAGYATLAEKWLRGDNK